MRRSKTSIEVSIPSQLGYEKVVRDVVASLARGLGFDAERIADIQTAISEACINAIEHGNKCQPRLRITVTFFIKRNKLDIVVADQGLCNCPVPEPLPSSIEQKISGTAEPRGMGLMLIHQLVDESGFLPSRRGQGNRFRLTLYRRRPRESASKSS